MKRSNWDNVRHVVFGCDIIIEVLDARFAFESRNFKLEEMIQRKKKKLIIVVCKMDLVPEDFIKMVIKKLSHELPTVYISTRERHGSKNLFAMINKISESKDVKIGVVGYPNVGKSSVINTLRGRHSASTSPMPGHTKGVQWIRISPHIMLMDTPGVVPLRGKRGLFLKGAMMIEKSEDHEQVVMNFIEDLTKRKSEQVIFDTYGVKLEPAEDFLERFAAKYHMLKKGGEYDTDRAARKIYNDWLKGKLKAYWD